jgi:threonine dehydrogenase-like Zn-dependent dehydrogenase
VVEQVMKLTGGKGVDLVVDPVGGATLEGSLGCRWAIAAASRWSATPGASR